MRKTDYHGAMNYLTPSQLTKLAPAAVQKIDGEASGNLIDTAAFLRFIEADRGYKPAVAVQGTPHSDSKSRAGSQGKHLVGAASNNGSAIFLLNSHTVRRRAWIASGFVRKGEQQPLCLIAAAMPLQRWRGFKEALEDLKRYQDAVLEMRKQMLAHAPSPADVQFMIAATVRSAYLPGHKPVAASELAGVRGNTMYDIAFALLERLHQPGRKAADSNRKVKALSGPDAVMQAGNAIFGAACRRLDQIGALPYLPALPTFRKT